MGTIAFFVLAVQLFVTLIEFKLTTLAGFVLVPFALWNKTSFLAEKVLGNVVSSGIKVLVLAVIVGIGSGLFSEFTVAPGADPSIDHALVIMLASLAMLDLGIFGPGIATGLVSGMAPGAARAAIEGGATAARSASALASGAKGAYQAGAAASTGGQLRAASAGVANVAKTGASAAGQRIASGTKAMKDRAAGFVAEAAAPAAASASGASADAGAATASSSEPAWAQRMRRKQQISHAATTTAHVLRSGDHGGGGIGPSLRDGSSS